MMTTREPVDAAQWLRIIESEYLEMPGLSLTKPQMQRLWGLESEICEQLVNALVAGRILRKTPDGGYVSGAAGV
jgi:hypothetical protein